MREITFFFYSEETPGELTSVTTWSRSTKQATADFLRIYNKKLKDIIRLEDRPIKRRLITVEQIIEEATNLNLIN